MTCTSATDHYEIVIGEREGEGYKIEGERDFIFMIYGDNVPSAVLVDGVKAKKGKVWTADKKTGVCRLQLPDDGMPHTIRLMF